MQHVENLATKGSAADLARDTKPCNAEDVALYSNANGVSKSGEKSRVPPAGVGEGSGHYRPLFSPSEPGKDDGHSVFEISERIEWQKDDMPTYTRSNTTDQELGTYKPLPITPEWQPNISEPFAPRATYTRDANTSSFERRSLSFAPNPSESNGEGPREYPDRNAVSSAELWPEIPEDTESHESLDVQCALEEGTLSNEIHILGMSTVGKFIAYGLASLPNPPRVTLLMQRPLLMQKWHEEGAQITVMKGKKIYTRSGFNIESAAPFQRGNPYQRFPGFGGNLEHTAEPPTSAIDTLIVATPPKVTLPALMAIRNRLRPSSAICIIQDGLGMLESLYNIVFPDSQRRPFFILGNLARPNNIARTRDAFTIIQNGDVQLTCSKMPQIHVIPATDTNPPVVRRDFAWTLPSAFLVKSLARVQELDTQTVGHKSFYRLQLIKTAVHAVIGLVSVLNDCKNEELLSSYNAKLTMRYLLDEISLVIRSLPELRNMPNVERDFAVLKLEKVARKTLGTSGNVMSKMLMNVKKGERTDIDFYAGYLLTRAAELGIECPRLEMAYHVVKGKQNIRSKAKNSYVPFSDD